MTYFVRRADVPAIERPQTIGYRMLDQQHGCVTRFRCGITIFTTTEYPMETGHADQDGFVVLEGAGWAIVGDEEQHIGPDDCFSAPAGVSHGVRRDPDVPYIKVAASTGQ
jgi:hypothetical protein